MFSGRTLVCTMADRTSVDVEDTPRLQIAKKSMWQSIFDNPKVLFIAFFASYVFPHRFGYIDGIKPSGNLS